MHIAITITISLIIHYSRIIRMVLIDMGYSRCAIIELEMYKEYIAELRA